MLRPAVHPEALSALLQRTLCGHCRTCVSSAGLDLRVSVVEFAVRGGRTRCQTPPPFVTVACPPRGGASHMYYLILLVTYSLAQIALVVWIGRRVRTTSDFFVAGRSLGPGLLFSTMLAANIGAGSTVGAAALGYRDGLSAVWWVGAASIGSLVLALWVG